MMVQQKKSFLLLKTNKKIKAVTHQLFNQLIKLYGSLTVKHIKFITFYDSE